MKTKLKTATKTKLVSLATALSVLAGASLSQAAVTLNFATQTGSANGPNGLPFVDANGAALDSTPNQLFAFIGYFSEAPNLAGGVGAASSAQSVQSRFVTTTVTPLTANLTTTLNSVSYTRDGLMNGQIYTQATNALPLGWTLTTAAVVVIGNASSVASSTALAAYQFGVLNAISPTTGLTQSFAVTSASVPILGTIRSVTTQPIPTGTPGLASPNSFVNGVVLTAIPEPSAALLGAIGALGLLRRRRI